MANKRNKSKAGSRYGEISEFEEFKASIDPRSGSWRKKPKGQTPLKQRAAELLARIQAKGENGLSRNSTIDKITLKKLVKNGDVYLKRIDHWQATRHTKIIATWFPKEKEEQVSEPYAKRKAALKEAGLHYKGKNQGKERLIKGQTVKWTPEKERQLLLDILKGKDTGALVKATRRTKTKMRKVIIPNFRY